MDKNVLAPSKATRTAQTTKSESPLAEHHDIYEVLFEQGLVGCPEWKRFGISPWPLGEIGEMVCLDEQGIGLLVADPAWLGVTLNFELDEYDVDMLRLDSAEDARVLCILSIHRDPPSISTNLAGPLIINVMQGIGRQVVLDHQSFPVRAPVIAGEAAAAIIQAIAGGDTDATGSDGALHHPPAQTPGKGA